MPGGCSTTLDRVGGCCMTLCLETGLWVIPQKENPVLTVRKIFAATSPLKPIYRNPQNVIISIILFGSRLSERLTKLCPTHEGKDKNSIYQFKQGDLRKGLQLIPKSPGGCGLRQWRFLWINFMNNILR